MSEEKSAEERSFIYVEFVEPGSVITKGITLNNVVAMQLLALAHWFEMHGKNAIIQEGQQDQQKQGVQVFSTDDLKRLDK